MTPVRGFLLPAVILGLLVIVPAASAAPPKPISVTTPMQRDLDANGYLITNAQSVTTGNLFSGGNVFSGGEYVPGGYQVFDGGGGGAQRAPVLTAGKADPTVSCPGSDPGGLYMRTSPVELWQKQSAIACDWQRIAP